MFAANEGVTPNDKLYVDDVFSTYLYTGNGSTQTITNGIDLSGKGGLVWIKARSAANGHWLFDTARGANYNLQSNNTNASGFISNTLTSFNSDGFSLGSVGINGSGNTHVSWTFRKAPKFFDVVTYTGNGVAGRQIPHSLGVVPGMVVVKCTSLGGTDWLTFHRSVSDGYLYLNSFAAKSTVGAAAFFGNGSIVVAPDATNIFIGSGDSQINQNGAQYVAYLFAHDTASDGLIQCGSFTTDASGNATVNLGWEPQYVLVKTTSSGSWFVLDNMRSMDANGGGKWLLTNASDVEQTLAYGVIAPNATGFTTSVGGQIVFNSSQTYIYLAIRRPNKPPTSGTQVFSAGALDLTNNPYVSYTANFPIDLFMEKALALSQSHWVYDRLRGGSVRLYTDTTDSETTGLDPSYYNYGFDYQGRVVNKNSGITSPNYFVRAFRRAPGFFDVVCYNSSSTSAATYYHSLGVVPELMIAKRRSGVGSWGVYFGDATKALILQGTNASITGTGYWNNTPPTAQQFTTGTGFNDPNATFVTYLFATKAGISKVGSYTGNGSSQTIDCGFTTGARFILIKRTDSTGDWYVWDSARGIVAANDPHLSLNTTATEVTTNDSVDPDSSGFIVNQNTATNINVSGASYIFLAIA